MLKWLADRFERQRAQAQAKLEDHLHARARPEPPPAAAANLDWLKRGNVCLNSGDIAEAARCYEQATRDTPLDAAAWVNLGFVRNELEQFDRAETALVQATALAPENVDAWYLLGSVLAQLRKWGEAEHALKQALALKPDFDLAYVDLCRTQFQAGAFEAARTTAEIGLLHAPGHVDLLVYLGNIHFHASRHDAALKSYQGALASQPDHAPAHLNLARALDALHRNDSALAHYRRAFELAPQDVDFLLTAGDALLARGLVGEASSCSTRALKLAPDRADAHLLMTRVHLASRNFRVAIEHSLKASVIEPHSAEAHLLMGMAHQELEQSPQSLACFSKAAELDPALVAARTNMGSVHLLQGRLLEAVAEYRKAIELSPLDRVANHNLLFALNYHPEMDAREIFRAYEEFDAKVCRPLRPVAAQHDNAAPTNRRLRIAYVSPDLRQHSVMQFLEPLLAHHDTARFEVFIYAQVLVEDAATERAKRYAQHWRSTVGVSDEGVANMIRADGIDVLVDVAGHTEGNRLRVFARKPAPVSVSWLGYGYTTGLSAIDYHVCDAVSVPEGWEHLFSEQPWRLDRCSMVFRPDLQMGFEGILPTAATGSITFATLTRAIRINDRVVRVWSEILRRTPGSTLVIDSRNYGQAEARDDMLARFAAQGVEASRLRVGYHSPPWDLLRGVDITLDCFPHNSGTTLFESLYMGIPYVTLAGRPSVGRLGASILHGIGHPEWIAEDEQAYVEIAVELARDPGRLAQLRSCLRQEMRESALMDERGLTQAIERSYEAMVQAWHDRRAAPHIGD